MLDDKAYRKKVLKRERVKNFLLIAVCLIAVILASVVAIVVPDSVRRVFNIVLVLIAIPSFLIIYLCVRWFAQVKRWPLAMGTVDEIGLDNEEDSPETVAKIRFVSDDGVEHVVPYTLSHYGDYVEGCEPELQKMLEQDKEKYAKADVPLFYSPRQPDLILLMLQDAEKKASD
ncbi:MAG: hypothetical protein IK106_05300 [Clostridiales bacterium]|nr:hypothetical protein [Clostridiales bacterium]